MENLFKSLSPKIPGRTMHQMILMHLILNILLKTHWVVLVDSVWSVFSWCSSGLEPSVTGSDSVRRKVIEFIEKKYEKQCTSKKLWQELENRDRSMVLRQLNISWSKSFSSSWRTVNCQFVNPIACYAVHNILVDSKTLCTKALSPLPYCNADDAYGLDGLFALKMQDPDNESTEQGFFYYTPLHTLCKNKCVSCNENMGLCNKNHGGV